ncbi:proline-rich protein 33 [Tamandua tetradactyla]|uniref:proline-rich protein 33 n=1 Tax=Tamandua tetradactyla TaxID=48850 RepID=UPI004053B39F
MLVSALPLPSAEGPPRRPPPLLPKPGKDNLRLQKLLRKAGRRPPAPLGPFRTSLSPVSEASHDQEAPKACGPHVLITRHVASPLQEPMLSASCAHVQPAPSPRAGTPEPPRTAPEGAPRAPAPAPQHPQTAPCVPVAHTRLLPAGAQAAQPRPEDTPVSRPPPGLQTPRLSEEGARVAAPTAPACHPPRHSPCSPAPAVPTAPACHSPRPAPCSPTPVAPTDPAARCPETPSSRLSGPHPKVAAEARPSGWTRLKQLLVEAEPPPAPGPQQDPVRDPQEPPRPASLAPRPPAPRASRLWDAVLYQASVAEARRRPAGPGEGQGGLAGLRRLPLLCRPRFDARRLREAARPPAPTLPVPRSFNRTATGWRLP